jgi:hypothetical protein
VVRQAGAGGRWRSRGRPGLPLRHTAPGSAPTHSRTASLLGTSIVPGACPSRQTRRCLPADDPANGPCCLALLCPVRRPRRVSGFHAEHAWWPHAHQQQHCWRGRVLSRSVCRHTEAEAADRNVCQKRANGATAAAAIALDSHGWRCYRTPHGTWGARMRSSRARRNDAKPSGTSRPGAGAVPRRGLVHGVVQDQDRTQREHRHRCQEGPPRRAQPAERGQGENASVAGFRPGRAGQGGQGPARQEQRRPGRTGHDRLPLRRPRGQGRGPQPRWSHAPALPGRCPHSGRLLQAEHRRRSGHPFGALCSHPG